MRWTAVLILAAFMVPSGLRADHCSAASASTPLGPSAGKWKRWDLALISTTDYRGGNGQGNPQRDLILKVTYTQCGISNLVQYKTQGFWYGLGGPNDDTLDGRAFRIRGAFPPGTWQWQVTCTRRADHHPATPDCSGDPSLNTQGRFQITTQGGGTLYNKGFLKVSNDKRYLTYDTGNERFFWLGDAVWNANILTSYNEWVTYINNRASPSFGANSQFTVVQLATAPKTAGNVDTDGNPPFDLIPPATSCQNLGVNCRWNPKFWKGVDAKIQHANSKGIVVLLAGFIEPIQKTLPGEDTETETTEAVTTLKEEAKIFAQSVAARLYGNFVIFSPGFDHRIDVGGGNQDIIKAIGDAIGGDQGVTTRHLVTNHSGGGTEPVDYISFLQNKPWLDFQLYQSGTPGNSEAEELKRMTERAGAAPPDDMKNLAVKVWKASPTKPAINGEATYAGQKGATNWELNHTPYRARQTGYLSLLSGSAGFAMGTCGVVDWNQHNGFVGCSPDVQGYERWDSPKAKATADSMKILRAIFQHVYWERLKPEFNRIKNQPSASHNKAALAYDGSSAVVAYVPKDNADITIDFNSGSGYGGITGLKNKATWPYTGTNSWAYVWISPRTGFLEQNPDQPTRQGANGIFKFKKPVCDLLPAPCDAVDWVLKITKKGAPQPMSSALALNVVSGIGSVSGDSRIISQTMDLHLEEVVSQTEIGGSSLTSPGPPQVATEPMGNNLVVWQREGEEEMSIAGLVLDSQGAVLTPEFAIASGSSASPGHPTVSTLASGDFLVAWSGTDEEGGGPWIRWATFDRFGVPLKPEQPAVNCKPIAGDFPQTTSLGEGGFAIAWEMSGGGIYVLRFDALGYLSDAVLGSKDEITVLESIEDGDDAPAVSYGLYGSDGSLVGGGESVKVTTQGSLCW